MTKAAAATESNTINSNHHPMNIYIREANASDSR